MSATDRWGTAWSPLAACVHKLRITTVLLSQVLFQVRSNSEVSTPLLLCCARLGGPASRQGRMVAQAEFEVIYEEAQLASKFAAIDQLCEEQGLCDAPGADGYGFDWAHISLAWRPAWQEQQA